MKKTDTLITDKILQLLTKCMPFVDEVSDEDEDIVELKEENTDTEELVCSKYDREAAMQVGMNFFNYGEIKQLN
jgi:hypothetical protein